MAIKITREEYEKKFGKSPVVSTQQPIKITRAEFEKKFKKPEGGRFDVPAIPESRPDKIARFQSETAQFQEEADKFKGFGFVKETGKEIAKTLLPGHAGLLETGKALGDAGSFEALAESSVQLGTQQAELRKRIRDKEARGEDATQLKRAFNTNQDTIEANKKQIESQRQALPTNKQFIGQVGAATVDTLAAGTFGKAAAGLKSGQSGRALPTIITPGKAGIAGQIKAVAPGAALGYSFDVTSGLQEGEENPFAPGIGTLIGVSAPLLSRMVTKTKNILPKPQKVNKEIDEVVGKITQSKKPFIRDKSANALKRLDTSDVKTYKDLNTKSSEKISDLSTSLDRVLSKDKTLYKIDDLVTTTKVGEQSVSTNHVANAFDDLTEIYTKNGEAEKVALITQLREKAATTGLTVQDINDLARTYGIDGKNAFSKLGDPLTGVTAVRAENTRKGVKEAARSRSENREVFELLDGEISDLFKLQDSSKKMAERVLALQNRVESKGLGASFGNQLFQLIDILSFRSAGGILRSVGGQISPSRGNLKTLNALELEKNLQKNLKKLDDLLDITNDIDFQKALLKLLNEG
jgi:hypothetical protein